jgi:hypothetical protein
MDDKTLWLLLAVLVVTTGIFVYPLISGTIEVDGCLDRGGRWDSIADVCDYRPEPPF